MKNWISNQIDKASWLRFAIRFVLLFAYSWWAFVAPGFWTRASEAAGPLPETLQGFPEGQPALAFSKLGEATSDYLIFQAIDVPFAFLNAMMISSAIALGVKQLVLSATPLRFLLILPLMALAADLTEDAFLVLMVSDILPDQGVVATLQQSVTNLKGAAGMLGTVTALAALVASAIVAVYRLIRGARS